MDCALLTGKKSKNDTGANVMQLFTNIIFLCTKLDHLYLTNLSSLVWCFREIPAGYPTGEHLYDAWQLARDKHSSLFGPLMINDHKMLYNIGPWTIRVGFVTVPVVSSDLL